MSDCLIPASFAIFLASAISSSNTSRLGGEIFLRITTSLSPTTTNWVPAFKLSCFRMFSGITTCPLEDILVVEIFAIAHLSSFHVLQVRKYGSLLRKSSWIFYFGSKTNSRRMCRRRLAVEIAAAIFGANKARAQPQNGKSVDVCAEISKTCNQKDLGDVRAEISQSQNLWYFKTRHPLDNLESPVEITRNVPIHVVDFGKTVDMISCLPYPSCLRVWFVFRLRRLRIAHARTPTNHAKNLSPNSFTYSSISFAKWFKK